MGEKITKAYKFRLYPTKKQQGYIDDSIRTSNFIFNYFLNIEEETNNILYNSGLKDNKERSEWRTEHNLWFNKYNASRHLTQLSKIEEYSFLKNSPVSLRVFTLRNLNDAFRNMKKIGAGFPKYKSKKNIKSSYTVQIQSPINPKQLSKRRFKVNLPGTPKQRMNDIIIAGVNDYLFDNINTIKINSATLSREGGKYYISFQCELDIDVPKTPKITKKRSIGVDMGVIRPITTSNENDFNDLIYSTKIKNSIILSAEIKRLQRILSKKRLNNKNWKQSNSYKRILKKFNKLINQQTNQANNIRHEISNQLINNDNYDTIIMEDLTIKEMTKKSPKGESNRKSHFNRVIVNTGLFIIRRQLEYKGKWNGKNIEKVDAAFTSLKCSNCGNVDKKNRISQSKFICSKCGYTNNADLNAAINIKNNYFEN